MLEKFFSENFRFLGSQAPQGYNIAHSTFAVVETRAGWWLGCLIVFFFYFYFLCSSLRGVERASGSPTAVVGRPYFMACWTWCSSLLVMPSSMLVWMDSATFSFVIICGMLTVLMDSIGIRSSLLRWNGM